MKSQPELIVICGVSGSGKSTIARELAIRRALRYLEADDFHSDEARQRMARGVPLNEQLRTPWLKAITRHLEQLAVAGEDCVFAFPGLRRAHRQALRNLGFRTTFSLLSGDKNVIRDRIKQRSGHFMPAALLDSQLRMLELPKDEPDVQIINAALSPAEIVSRLEQRLPPA